MKNKMGNRSRRSTMAIAILCILGVLSVAYAAFSTNLKINLAGTSKNDWNIQFDNVSAFRKGDGDVSGEGLISTSESAYKGDVNLDEGKVNLEISNVKFVNLDNKFCYLIPVVNNGNVTADLTQAPTITLKGSNGKYTYYDPIKRTEIEYSVTYNSTLYDLGKLDSKTASGLISYTQCMNMVKEKNNKVVEVNNENKISLSAGEKTYWLLAVDTTYNETNTVPGNTVLEGDTITCTVTEGIWNSTELITTILPPPSTGTVTAG